MPWIIASFTSKLVSTSIAIKNVAFRTFTIAFVYLVILGRVGIKYFVFLRNYETFKRQWRIRISEYRVLHFFILIKGHIFSTNALCTFIDHGELIFFFFISFKKPLGALIFKNVFFLT